MSHPNAFRFEDYPNAARFRPVAPANIEALAKRHDLTFCDDYLAFLQRHNGYNFDSITAAPPWAREHRLIDFLRYIFGIETGWEYNDLARRIDGHILDPAYLRFVYPIGQGPGGNPVVQVHQGKLRGQIMLIDNDLQMSAEEFEETAKRKLESYAADQLIPWFRDTHGSFVAIGENLSVFLDDLLVAREDSGAINVAIVAKDA